MPDIYLVCDNIGVFYTLYLCEFLVLSSDLEKPSAIRNQITLVGHAELMSNRQLPPRGADGRLLRGYCVK